MKRFCLATAVASVVAGLALSTLVGAAPASSETETGMAQSPIDLRRSEVTFVHRLSTIHFSYPRRADVTVTNTGSPDEEATVRANVPAGAASITLRRNALRPAAVPLAHAVRARDQRPQEPDGDAPGPRRRRRLAARHRRLHREGADERTLEPIFEDLPEHAGDTRDVAGVRIDKLLPHERSSYRYMGSLTTPPFTEGCAGSCSPTRSRSRSTRSARSVSCSKRGTAARSAAQRSRGAERRPAAPRRRALSDSSRASSSATWWRSWATLRRSSTSSAARPLSAEPSRSGAEYSDGAPALCGECGVGGMHQRAHDPEEREEDPDPEQDRVPLAERREAEQEERGRYSATSRNHKNMVLSSYGLSLSGRMAARARNG